MLTFCGAPGQRWVLSVRRKASTVAPVWLAGPVKPVDLALNRLAARQLGLVERGQALDLGMTPRQLQLRLDAGLLVPVQPRVYRVAAVPPSWDQALLAACLSSGGVASHRAAAALWGLRGCERGPVEIAVAGRRRPELHGVTAHTTEQIERADVTVRRRVPVTVPARTLLDLGAVVGVDMVESAVEDAVLRELVSFRALQRTIERLGRSGNGAGVLRALVEARDPATAPSESVLEDALVRTLRGGRLPDPVRQHRVGRVRVDLAYPEVHLAIEADSRIWHAGRGDVQRNTSKQNELVARGWRVLRFTWFDVKRRPGYVVATVRPLLSRAA